MDHLHHSPESYDIALKLLKTKYGGSDRQIQNMYNQVKHIKLVKDFHSMQKFQYALLGVHSMMASHNL